MAVIYLGMSIRIIIKAVITEPDSAQIITITERTMALPIPTVINFFIILEEINMYSGIKTKRFISICWSLAGVILISGINILLIAEVVNSIARQIKTVRSHRHIDTLAHISVHRIVGSTNMVRHAVQKIIINIKSSLIICSL
jgi:hypothetical protein